MALLYVQMVQLATMLMIGFLMRIYKPPIEETAIKDNTDQFDSNWFTNNL